jgi:hypothetical protein
MRRLVPGTYLALGCAAIAIHLVLGRESALGHILLYDTIGASAVVAMAVGIRTRRPPRTHAWIGLTVGQALFVAGDVIWTSYDLAGAATPFPSPADAIYLSSRSSRRSIRRRRRGSGSRPSTASSPRAEGASRCSPSRMRARPSSSASRSLRKPLSTVVKNQQHRPNCTMQPGSGSRMID